MPRNSEIPTVSEVKIICDQKLLRTFIGFIRIPATWIFPHIERCLALSRASVNQSAGLGAVGFETGRRLVGRFGPPAVLSPTDGPISGLVFIERAIRLRGRSISVTVT